MTWKLPQSKIYLLSLLALAGCLLFFSGVKADNFYYSYPEILVNDAYVGGIPSGAQSFPKGRGMITKASSTITGELTWRVRMMKQTGASETCSLYAAIFNLNQTTYAYTTTHASSTNTVLCSDLNTEASFNNASSSWFTYHFENVNLTVNTKYALVVYSDNDDNDAFYLSYDDTGVSDTDFVNHSYSNSGGAVTRVQDAYLLTYIIEGYWVDNTKLQWNFPLDDYVLNNSEWNDWSLIYDLDESDLGNWNILMVHYTDSSGKTTTDWEEITTTTDLTAWTINRSRDLPDGQVSSQARITKIENCANYYDDDCRWTDVAITNFIYWTASSSGYTIFDNPWELPGFTPASSSAETDADAGVVGQLWQRVKNIFPLSIGFQLQDTFRNISTAGATTSLLNIPLNSLLPEVMASQIATSVVVISSDVWNTGIPFWSTTILPTLNYLVYLGYVILIVYIMWPKAKQAVD